MRSSTKNILIVTMAVISMMPCTDAFRPGTGSSRPYRRSFGGAPLWAAPTEPPRPSAAPALAWPRESMAERLKLTRSGAPASRPPGVLSPGEAIRGLYKAFNDRNVTAAASFLDDECLYEDLLLGPNTICRGKEAFTSVLRFHPAFVTSALFSQVRALAQWPPCTHTRHAGRDEQSTGSSPSPCFLVVAVASLAAALRFGASGADPRGRFRG